MRFTYRVSVEAERIEGKFESRESLGNEIEDALKGADPGEIVGDNDGTYEVTQWDVDEVVT